MFDELEMLEFMESETLHYNNEKKLQRKRRRDESDPFEEHREQFIKRYRLSQDMVETLCDDLRPHVPVPKKSTDLSLSKKVLVALSFYATGSYQCPIGDIGSHAVSQTTVSAIINQITMLLNLPEIRDKYIRFPRTTQDRRAKITRFYNKFGMPGVLGCIDCSHVAIIRPAEFKERYYCRKQYHSLNVQLICDADLEIVSVDASFGGANHDSYIWANHPIKQHLEGLSRNESVCLLGDSGYPLRKFLLTPFLNTTPGTQEAHYNALHMKTRNVVERTIGLLKARFRCLLVHQVLTSLCSTQSSIHR